MQYGRVHHSVPGAVNAFSRTHRRRAQPPPLSSAAERGPTYPTVLAFFRSPTSSTSVLYAARSMHSWKATLSASPTTGDLLYG